MNFASSFRRTRSDGAVALQASSRDRLTEPREIGLRVKHAHDAPAASDGYRVLVDRRWPRDSRKEDLQLDAWEKDLAPSDALRRWFGHDAERWGEFVRRYREELSSPAADARLAKLARLASTGPVTLVYTSPDPAHNNALVLLQTILPRLMDAFADPARRAA
jgi:uncharacterized protein YeaO (DUF488 family)